jgi:hypothetical protein
MDNNTYEEAMTILNLLKEKINEAANAVDEINNIRRKSLEEGYKQGWLAASGWAKEYHLNVDVDSLAYIACMEEILDKITKNSLKVG